MPIDFSQERLIMLPFDPGFYDILHRKLPQGYTDYENCYVTKPDSGVVEAVTFEQAMEYALGGEYDELGTDDELDDEFDLLEGV